MKKIILFLVLALLNISLVNADSISVQIGSYPDSLDYRDYMDQNWMTSAKQQGGCGSCWAHAANGAIEGLVNLYYNHHFNLDLSEQQLVSSDGFCLEVGSCLGGNSATVYNYAESNPIFSENCFPYEGEDIACDLCTDPDAQVGLGGFENVNWNLMYPLFHLQKIKSTLFNIGTGNIDIDSWNHAMTLAGYDKNNNLIIKNSWGRSWGDNGYVTLSYDKEDMIFSFPKLPLVSINNENGLNSYNPCKDLDEDGYCYWGKSNDISSCEDIRCETYSNGELIKDFDDSNPEKNILKDIWIDQITTSFDKSAKYDKKQFISLNIKYFGDPIELVRDINVNFYDNNRLLETKTIKVIEHDSYKTLIFEWIPKRFGENKLKFEIEPLNYENEGFLENNHINMGVWVYKYYQGFTINENNAVFDCEERGLNPLIGPNDGIGVDITLSKGISQLNNIQIQNCILTGWSTGIESEDVINLNLLNNQIFNNEKGISIGSTSNSLIENNLIKNNFLLGISATIDNSLFKNNKIMNNGIDGGLIIKANSNNNVFINNTIENNTLGFSLGYQNNTLINNTFVNNYEGLSIKYPNNIIDNNVFINNENSFILNSENNILTNNTLVNNTLGLILYHPNNFIANNYICNNDYFDLVCLIPQTETQGEGNYFNSYTIGGCGNNWPIEGVHFENCE